MTASTARPADSPPEPAPPYRMRPARLDDVAALQATAATCWYATYGEIYTPVFIANFLARAYTPAGLRHAIQDAASCFLVVAREDELVGFGQVGPAFHAGDGPQLAPNDLYRLYLLPEYQRQGLGSCLLGGLEAWLREQGADCYGCYVHARNEIGKTFYARKGFIRQPIRDSADEWYLLKKTEVA